MLRSIGEIADGGLPLLFPPESYPEVLACISEGADRAGRDLVGIDIAACIWCSVSDDRSAAQDVLREKIAYYGHSMSPLILHRLGLTQADFQDIERAAMAENNLEKAKSLVTEPMMRIGIAGEERGEVPGEKYVLSPFTKPEHAALGDIINRASDAVIAGIKEGFEKAAQTYNQKNTESA